MLNIIVPGAEYFKEDTFEFITIKEQKLQLEHSLVSLSKWESKWCKPFLSENNKTTEMNLDYIRCMTLTQNVDPKIYYALTSDNIKEITEYINAPMTATWFSQNDKNSKKNKHEIVTAEIIYYWMIAYNIPFECQKWHLNRLLTLIQVCNIKNNPQKISKKDLLNRNRALNEARRAKFNSKG